MSIDTCLPCECLCCMSAHMCRRVCTRLHKTNLHKSTDISEHTSIHMSVHVCAHVCAHVYIHVGTTGCAHVHTHVCTHVCIHIRTHICACVVTQVHVSIHMRMHMSVDMSTYMSIQNRRIDIYLTCLSHVSASMPMISVHFDTHAACRPRSSR